MKKYLTLLILLFLSSCEKKQIKPEPEFKKAKSIASKIDSLNSISAVEAFIYSKDFTFKDFKVKSLTENRSDEKMNRIGLRIADSVNANKPYYKIDLDNNGYQDLLVTGSFNYDSGPNSIAILNYAHDSVKFITTTPMRDTYTVPKITFKNKQPLVQVFYPDIIDWETEKTKTVKRILTVKFSDFIEYNPKVIINDIEKIEYSTTRCYGTCPVFELVINNDKSVIYKPLYYNFTETEKLETQILKTTLATKEYNQIIELLNYTDFPNLKDSYSVSWTDDQTSTLKITYNNGKVKSIRDYGLCGTYGLRRLNELLFNLRTSQKWK